ncbi:MAG: S-methyl-5-thioribose-1-phosphate isomerase [Chloroflexi bacterium]|nr:S-methyl-5-thioribose-1-phosphate isomerase [Chloroflexota bacterium]
MARAPEDASTREPYQPVAWRDGRLWLLDQTLLPAETRYIPLDTTEDAAEAITTMRVRGAPAIGVTAAYALAVAARTAPSGVAAAVEEAARRLGATRPTAVNLRWALDRVAARVAAAGSDEAARDVTLAEARAIHEEQHDADARMAELGAALFPEGSSVLTLCNTGPLATAGGGTALGVIVEAWRGGRLAEVLACETRPRLQGARLTAWELQQHDVPFRLIVEGAAASLMAAGRVDAVVTGADRVAANGDTANKIGTYMLAVLARHHGIPFYIVAPVSTLDPHTPDGASIPIEERDDGEVLRPGGADLAAPGARALNPAFDVTPAELIDAIVTEQGVLRAPYGPSIAAAIAAASPVGVEAAP